MKSQDIFLLLKLTSLSQQEKGIPLFLKSKWEGWEVAENYRPEKEDAKLFRLKSEEFSSNLRPSKTVEDTLVAQYSVRSLAETTGISKSEISLVLQRCYDAGLAKPDRLTGIPRANLTALKEFIGYGLRYVFPAKPSEITRGIATAWAAPVLKGKIMSAGEFAPVWPDARGSTKGQAILPLFKSVPYAVRRDPRLYEMLALTDAIRIGQPRERKMAIEQFDAILERAR